MVKINFDVPPTNSIINVLIQYIKKNGINDKLYADIAKLFTMDTSKVTEKFLKQLAYLFASYDNNPILVLEVKMLLKENNELFKKYGKYFKNYEGVNTMFGISSQTDFSLENYTIINNSKTISSNKIITKYKKKSKNNTRQKFRKIKKQAQLHAQTNYEIKLCNKIKKQKEYQNTELLIKKFNQ